MGLYEKKASLALNLRLEMFTAVLIAVGILVGTIEGVPPFGKLMALNEQIKDYWESVPTTAPAPHTEELSIERACPKHGPGPERRDRRPEAGRHHR